MFGIGALPSWSSGTPAYEGDCTVWLQVVGWGPATAKATLCEEALLGALSGDLNVTVPPVVISTVLSPAAPAASWKKLSPAVIVASEVGALDPAATAGTPISATTAQAIHGRYRILTDPISPPTQQIQSRRIAAMPSRVGEVAPLPPPAGQPKRPGSVGDVLALGRVVAATSCSTTSEGIASSSSTACW